MWKEIANAISEAKGITFEILKANQIAGGCINEAYHIKNNNQSYFVKLNHKNRIDMLAAEADGLREITATNTIKAPSPVCLGTINQKAYLVLDYIRSTNGKSQMQLGENLAKLHSIHQNKFGWHRNNNIGLTKQLNPFTENWAEFFRKYRLEFQINLAKANGFHFQGTELLLNKFDDFFCDYKPKPSLLHGDLWSGNFAFDDLGIPFVFDPSNYYGDREAEFGLTEMFGGFSAEFWNGYESIYPLDQGFSIRKGIYRLYHTLNHLNLFGSQYAFKTQELIKKLTNN